ncbi:MAG TPA: hypothetical protein VKY90_21200 [Candidatus Dormibacteraeota bacterium]|nr:hypothetical protein [Candidatus Dormibacteraeota bacterium]
MQLRWPQARRASVGFDILCQDWQKTIVTHRMPFERAAEAYRLLDMPSEEVQEVLLTYP